MSRMTRRYFDAVSWDDGGRWARFVLSPIRPMRVAIGALAIVAAACGGISAADRMTYTVGVDGTSDELNVSLLKFFPDSLTVHPGDTIRFQRPETGEMHTVTLGTDIPSGGGVPGGNFFQFGFGSKPLPERGMPCYLSEGRPEPGGCTSEEQQKVPFDGTQSWHNSGGLIGGDDPYDLELADDIEPGFYTVICLIHTAEMRATIKVVDSEEPADDPDEVVARGKDEVERRSSNLLNVAKSVRPSTEGSVMAGFFTTESFGAEVPNWAMQFFPDEVEVSVGDTVTWEVRGDHTISFNAPEAARPFYERGEDNSIIENELAATPSGDPNAWDGSGFLNSALLSGFDPPDRFSVTFTQPGTYTYFCLVHFDMEGKVKVSG